MLGWQLDHEVLTDAGSYLGRLKMYPIFDSAHYILTCVATRDDLGTNFVTFSRRHPFSCWLSSMLMCFAGGFLSSFLLGEPVISPFKRHDDVILASAVWYLVYYSPFDIVYKLTRPAPLRILLYIAKEIQRAFKISHGVAYAAKLYPRSYLVQVLVGVAKGAGAGVVKIVEQLIRGSWVPNQHELLSPTFTTKASVIAAIVFTLERNAMYITAPHGLVYLSIVGFFVYFKLSAVILGVTDAFAPLENLFCAVFMGGIWDAFHRAVDATRADVVSRQPRDDDILNNNVKKKKERKNK